MLKTVDDDLKDILNLLIKVQDKVFNNCSMNNIVQDVDNAIEMVLKIKANIQKELENV